MFSLNSVRNRYCIFSVYVLFNIPYAAHTTFQFQLGFVDAPCFRCYFCSRVSLRFTRGY